MPDHSPAVVLANLRHLYDHLAHGRVGGVKAQQAQAEALLAPAIEMLERMEADGLRARVSAALRCIASQAATLEKVREILEGGA